MPPTNGAHTNTHTCTHPPALAAAVDVEEEAESDDADASRMVTTTYCLFHPTFVYVCMYAVRQAGMRNNVDRRRSLDAWVRVDV